MHPTQAPNKISFPPLGSSKIRFRTDFDGGSIIAARCVEWSGHPSSAQNDLISPSCKGDLSCSEEFILTISPDCYGAQRPLSHRGWFMVAMHLTNPKHGIASTGPAPASNIRITFENMNSIASLLGKGFRPHWCAYPYSPTWRPLVPLPAGCASPTVPPRDAKGKKAEPSPLPCPCGPISWGPGKPIDLDELAARPTGQPSAHHVARELPPPLPLPPLTQESTLVDVGTPSGTPLSVDISAFSTAVATPLPPLKPPLFLSFALNLSEICEPPADPAPVDMRPPPRSSPAVKSPAAGRAFPSGPSKSTATAAIAAPGPKSVMTALGIWSDCFGADTAQVAPLVGTRGVVPFDPCVATKLPQSAEVVVYIAFTAPWPLSSVLALVSSVASPPPPLPLLLTADQRARVPLCSTHRNVLLPRYLHVLLAYAVSYGRSNQSLVDSTAPSCQFERQRQSWASCRPNCMNYKDAATVPLFTTRDGHTIPLLIVSEDALALFQNAFAIFNRLKGAVPGDRCACCAPNGPSLWTPTAVTGHYLGSSSFLPPPPSEISSISFAEWTCALGSCLATSQCLFCSEPTCVSSDAEEHPPASSSHCVGVRRDTLDVLRIALRSYTFAPRRSVLITSRVHPAEVSATSMFRGLVDALTLPCCAPMRERMLSSPGPKISPSVSQPSGYCALNPLRRSLLQENGDPTSRKGAMKPSCEVNQGRITSSCTVRAVMSAMHRKVVWLLVPCLNPDGVHRGYSRADSCRYNLNRVYALDGDAAIWADGGANSCRCRQHRGLPNFDLPVPTVPLTEANPLPAPHSMTFPAPAAVVALGRLTRCPLSAPVARLVDAAAVSLGIECSHPTSQPPASPSKNASTPVLPSSGTAFGPSSTLAADSRTKVPRSGSFCSAHVPVFDDVPTGIFDDPKDPVFIDLHAHVTRSDAFVFGNVSPDRAQQLVTVSFPRILQLHVPKNAFSIEKCRFTNDSEEGAEVAESKGTERVLCGTSRVVMGHVMRSGAAYTLEVNYHPFSQQMLQSIGAAIGSSLLDAGDAWPPAAGPSPLMRSTFVNCSRLKTFMRDSKVA